MIGVPVTSGFISKWYLVLGAIYAGKWVGTSVILISSLLTAVYFWRIIDKIFFIKPKEHSLKKIHEPLSLLIPVYILVGLTIYFGLFPSNLISYTKKAAELLLGTMK